jgi:peptidoglycan/LPS O-acetylase OafA/YrhL
MGISILWITFYHAQTIFGNPDQVTYLQHIWLIGYGGVDIFFFLSGFSLACGWLKKKYTLKEFYEKRFLRIVPTYWIWMFFSGLFEIFVIKDFHPRGFIADFLLGSGFLLNKSYNYWFVPSILICYLLFPMISYFIARDLRLNDSENRSFLRMLLISSFLPLLVCMALILLKLDKLLFLLIRIPNFVLGAYIGFAYFQDKARSLKDLRINSLNILLILIGGFYLIYLNESLILLVERFTNGLGLYPYILIAFPLCCVLANLLAWVDRGKLRSKTFKWVKQCLKILGKYSFELFLVHSFFFRYIVYLNQANSSKLLIFLNQDNFLSYSILICISLVFAYVLHESTRMLPFLKKG